jgi:hypothetical protein
VRLLRTGCSIKGGGLPPGRVPSMRQRAGAVKGPAGSVRRAGRGVL